MFVLGSDITIGKYVHVKPHAVKITKSIFEYVDRAKITLPITARIVRDGKVITATAETAKQFGEGDKVGIKLGYNGVLRQEFEGFVSRVNFTSPLEIECEGYSYQLRKKTYKTKKLFAQTKLIDILKFIVLDTDILIVKENITDVVVEKLLIQGQSGTELLEELKKKMDNLISFHFRDNYLIAELFPIVAKKTNAVKYRLGWNVIKDNNLKLREAKNVQVTVKYTGKKKDGTKVTAYSGNGGEVKEYTTHDFTDMASLQKLSNAQLSRLSYDGYEGKITAFLTPYCETGDKLDLTDAKYAERGGSYLIETVEVSYGMGGARRIVGIGCKL